jgi:purine-binding chemotaxis protein CheW
VEMIKEGQQIAQQIGAHDAAQAGARGGEYLTFRLGDEEYGIDILRVQEIRSYEPPTRIANAPAHIKGVVNLRGVIVPIVDLRVQLGCANAEFNHLTVVVVLNVKNRVVGAVVDSVSDVLELGSDTIKPAPTMTASAEAEHITGIGTVKTEQGQRMLILLDIEALMAGAGLGLTETH